jgi:large subunit ribosomal protein L24
MPIAISNVLLVCSSCGQPARTGSRIRKDGSKERYCKKCDAGIGVIAPPRASKAGR